MVLATEPWQWTADPTNNNKSTLLDPSHWQYMSYKTKIEKAVDDLMYADPLWDKGSYVGTKVSRFMKGPIVPVGIFRHIRPPTTTTENPIVCPLAMLSALSVPADFVREGSGDVKAGKEAVYKCAGTDKFPFKADGTLYSPTDHRLKFNCSADGSSFSGVPANAAAYPNCTAITAQCTVPAPPAGMDAQADTTDRAIGVKLTYNCTNTTLVLSTTQENGIEVECKVATGPAPNNYQVTFGDPTAWGTCGAPAAPAGKKRRRRTATVYSSDYNYITAQLEVTFMKADVTHDELAAFFEKHTRTNATEPKSISPDIKVDKDCKKKQCYLRQGELCTCPCTECEHSTECEDPRMYYWCVTAELTPFKCKNICKLNQLPLTDTTTCSNLYFESLVTSGYSALTRIGYYQPPDNVTFVDVSNVKYVAEIAELRCTSTSPEQVPLFDNQDHNPDDSKLTVFCRPPTSSLHSVGSWSIDPLPDCVSICRPPSLPEPPHDTDLETVGIRPIRNKTHVSCSTHCVYRLSFQQCLSLQF